jgi:hypothetical protein
MWPRSSGFGDILIKTPCYLVHENVHMAWVRYPRLLGPFLPKSHVILPRLWPREYTFRELNYDNGFSTSTICFRDNN